ncbi:multicopper oxidase family protein [Thermicanus aegyptius]|uniref:multicopper oxidase family protein n=1 Tax=Thermicanus aegyptius TaxID=94009 RepID=UPI00041D4FC1|nr:copper oxidase [Thermicanus aegyptius]
MKKLWMFVVIAIIVVAAGSALFIWGGSGGDSTKAKADDSLLTTTKLRDLPPLVETDEIKPTGKTKSFTLEISPGKWELVKGTTVDAITINGTVPGPEIRVTEGDLVRVTVKNNLKEETSIHWHGLHVPNSMDGVPPFTQQGIKPGESFTYEFTANHAGTFMYHSHLNSVEQIDKGLYGAFIIDPQNPEKQPTFDQDITWVLSGWIVNNMGDMNGSDGNMAQGMNMNYNYWTINGKAFPDTKPITVKTGEKVRMRLINISNLAHPMHLHGHDFRVIAEDGHPLSSPRVLNTLDVAPGKTYEIEFIADNPGTWVFHCHELHHTMNGEVEPGGLIGVIQYEGAPKNELPSTEGNGSGSDQKGTQDMGNMPGMGN